jgi:hypothetical protein
MQKELYTTLKWFAPISLTQLNSTVQLLDRVETKYMIHLSQLPALLQHLQEHFFVLEIKDNILFTYDNVYMDTKNYDFYFQHLQGKKQRTKVRTRHYVESGDLVFFEYKQKIKNLVRKFRYQYGIDNHGAMTNEAMKFYEGIYWSIYGDHPHQLIFPVLNNTYNRLTLCSKQNDERLTIDLNLSFADYREKDQASAKRVPLDNVVIIESKSVSGDTLSHHLMRQEEIQPMPHCSKYCLGMYYLKKVNDWKLFQPVIDKINELGTTKHVPVPSKIQLHHMVEDYAKQPPVA